MKKKTLIIFLCGIMSLSFTACSSKDVVDSQSLQSNSATSESISTTTPTPEIAESEKEDKNGYNDSANTKVQFWGHDLSVPSYWVSSGDDSFDNYTYYAEEDGIIVAMLQFQCNSTTSMNRDNIENDFDNIISSLDESLDNFNELESGTTPFCGEDAYTADFTCTMNDGTPMQCRTVATKHDGSSNMYAFFLMQSENSHYDYFGDFEKMINDAVYGTDSDTATPTITSTPSPAQDIPVEYNNALSKAHDYLDYSAFSYTGLIDQLEYEGYSTESSTYAADNCGADWNEQALKKAQSYLDFSSFSYTGLMDQLKFEGFTDDQSTYAADNCGADWNEQAAKKAQSYLDFTSFSRQGLIDQLIYEGFTAEQAEYGASAVGY